MIDLNQRAITAGILTALGILWFLIAMSALTWLTGCAAQEVKPEVRTETNVVLVPTLVPCLDRKDIPIRPSAIAVSPTTSTTEQLAAAIVLDVGNYETYMALTEKLLNNCAGDKDVD